MRTAKHVIVLIIVAACLSATTVAAKEEGASMKFPEMGAFHEVIYKIWHEYYPAGDFEAVRAICPKLSESMEALSKAELPEVYQHRSEVFQKRRAALQASVDDLVKMAKEGDDAAMKSGVERLHHAFHGLVRAIHSRPRSLDEFHAVLYLMWHEDYPKKDLDALKKRIPELSARMDRLMAQTLKGPYRVSAEAYDSARDALNKEVRSLVDSLSEGGQDAVWKALNRVHDRYRELDHLFDG